MMRRRWSCITYSGARDICARAGRALHGAHPASGSVAISFSAGSAAVADHSLAACRLHQLATVGRFPHPLICLRTPGNGGSVKVISSCLASVGPDLCIVYRSGVEVERSRSEDDDLESRRGSAPHLIGLNGLNESTWAFALVGRVGSAGKPLVKMLMTLANDGA
jgi:hypothetical protein